MAARESSEAASTETRAAALGAAATLMSGRGMNRTDRPDELLGNAVLDLAERFVPWLETGKRGRGA